MEKPILFNTEMVEAILEGKKTCTRRIIKNKYENADIDWFENKYGKRLVYIQNDAPAPRKNPNGTTTHSLVAMEEIKKPCQIGDVLYVRETWKIYKKRVGSGQSCCVKGFYGYKADEDNPNNPSEFYDGNWKPSIHMPKEAARLFLKVTNVRAERLHQMTTNEILKEGLYSEIFENYFGEANPWVWVIEFERIER